jgi:hypothetical protein
MEEEVKQPQQEGGEAGKVEKRFTANMQKLVAIFKGEGAFKKVSIPNGESAAIIEELMAEERELAKKSFKEKAAKLIKSKVEFDKFVKQKEKELQDAIVNKKKDFNKEMEECFSLLENIDKLKEEYVSSLTSSEEK